MHIFIFPSPSQIVCKIWKISPSTGVIKYKLVDIRKIKIFIVKYFIVNINLRIKVLSLNYFII